MAAPAAGTGAVWRNVLYDLLQVRITELEPTCVSDVFDPIYAHIEHIWA